MIKSTSTDKSAETYGHRSAKGLAWLTVQTVGGKGVSLIGQTVLAWLLSPKDFGLIGLAYTASSIVGILNSFGLEQVLVHRQKRFARWANAAFWMSLALGVVAGIVMAVAAPLVAKMYHEPRLVGLLLVLAISAPLNNLIIVPRANVQSQLRFRFMAGTGFARAILTMGLTVLFAALGFETYSFVLPVPIVAIGMACWYWRAAPVPIHWRMEWHRWRFLFGDSALLFVSGLFYMAISQGDYFTLGLFYSAEVVGLYYFAFNLSMQSVNLFTVNLSNILFPVLSKLNDDPARQTAAFVSSTRVLALVAIPACFLQAALAEPVLHLLFDARWQGSIVLLQILSVAMALRVVSWPTGSLLMAQGRFSTRTSLAIISALVFFPLVLVGVKWGGAVGAAWAVLVFFAIIMPLNLYVTLRPGRVRFAAIIRLFGPAIGTGAVTFLAANFACLWLSKYRWGGVPRIVLVSLIGLGLYSVIMRKMDEQSWLALMVRLRPMMKSLKLRVSPG